ncbi:hypothetical protein F66182_15401 [Fusarium sp. NRRL 66182]|nr:hypothetical protein F66182_15401 [Fusarium sp. NRRL 66182]
MISIAQDHCRALHPHDALEPVHTLAPTRAPHQEDAAHREDAQGIVDVEVQVIVATVQGLAATPIEAAAPAGTGLKGPTTDGDEPSLIRACFQNLLLTRGTKVTLHNSSKDNHLLKEWHYISRCHAV